MLKFHDVNDSYLTNNDIDYQQEIEKAIAIENSMRTVNIDGESMKVAFLTDEIIESNNLLPITNPIFFERDKIPTSDGLFSETIFGTTSKERNSTHAYINLKKKFFHPYVYEVLKNLGENIDKCCSGEGSWIITKDGELKEIKDPDDTLYNEENR